MLDKCILRVRALAKQFAMQIPQMQILEQAEEAKLNTNDDTGHYGQSLDEKSGTC